MRAEAVRAGTSPPSLWSNGAPMTTPTLPPGPRSALPQLVHMNDPFPYMVRLAKEYRDPITCPMIGADPMVITWSPEGVREVFSADPDTFAPGANDALSAIVGRGSIFLQSGAQHRRTRKLLTPPFHGDRMRAYGELMRSIAQRATLGIPAGVSAPLLPVTQGVTLDIIIEAIFGERDPERTRLLHRDIVDLVATFNPLIASFRFMQREFGGVGPWARFQRAARSLHAKIRALMDERRARPGGDILSMLLAVRDEDGAGLPDVEVIDQLVTFVVAGHETTATTLAWAMYELHRAPDALARLRADLAALGDDVSPESLAGCPLLGAVCDETLRLHPPVPIVPRRLVRPLTLGGFALPAGTVVGVGIYLAHLREATFADPMTFRPERFVERTYTPFEFLPFGGGARRCLGAAFASYELRVVLATLLSAGAWSLDEPRPVGNAFRIGTFGPATGVRMTLTRGAARSRGR